MIFLMSGRSGVPPPEIHSSASPDPTSLFFVICGVFHIQGFVNYA